MQLFHRQKRSTYPYIYKQGHLNKPNSTRWLSQSELITGHGSTWNGIRRHRGRPAAITRMHFWLSPVYLLQQAVYPQRKKCLFYELLCCGNSRRWLNTTAWTAAASMVLFQEWNKSTLYIPIGLLWIPRKKFNQIGGSGYLLGFYIHGTGVNWHAYL